MNVVGSSELWIVQARADNQWIARKWHWHRGTYLPSRESIRAARIETLRERLPAGLTRRERLPGDAPGVVEVWR